MVLFTKLSLFAALAASSITPFAQAQFVRPPTDLITKAGSAGISIRYKEVPTGTCETRAQVKHLSGFADISPNSHIHFQFFETRKGDPKKAPLTIWLNGGPGSSSMLGLFQEIGSCSINSDLKAVDNPHAWNEVSNVIYIDQPVTSGNSYSEPGPAYINPDTGLQLSLPDEKCPDYAVDLGTCGTYSSSNITGVPTLTVDAAQSFYLALQGFIGVFPEYAANGVNIASESYGGHYSAAFGKLIVEKKREGAPGHTPIDLRSVLCGNGWYEAAAGYTAYVSYMKKNPYGVTYPNSSIVDEIDNALHGRGNCIDQIKECYRTDDPIVCVQANNYCDSTLQHPFTAYLNRSVYDIRQPMPSPFPPEYYADFLNLEATQKALGLFQNYTSSSTTVNRAFSWAADSMREGRQSVDKLRFLLDAGVHVALFAGDADFICNIDLQDAVTKLVGAKGFDQAGWVNLTTSDGVVHGQAKQSGSFSFTQFYGSGHEVPFYAPVASLEFFDRVINRKDVATGKQDIAADLTYKTIGPIDNFVFHGNATVEFKALPKDSTYNPATERGDPPKSTKDLLFGNSKPSKQAKSSKALPNQSLRRRAGSLSFVHDRS